MKIKIILNLVLCLLCLSACSMGPHSMIEPKPPGPQVVPENIKEESASADRDRRNIVQSLEKKALKKLNVAPVMPKYNPLEDHIVSFSMIDEDLNTVLYSLAQSAGMNLIIDSGVTKEKHMLTLNFQDVSAATVLKEILKAYDIYYEID